MDGPPPASGSATADTVDHGEADAKIKSFNQAKAERFLAERDPAQTLTRAEARAGCLYERGPRKV